MSSSTDILAAMQSAQKYLYQFGCPILIFIGIIGCILNLIIFTQKVLRKNPCSIYFIGYNLANLIYIHSSLLPLAMSLGYNIDSGSHNLSICRLRLYLIVLSNVLSPFYLILASIDRILVTSQNALTRQRSTRRFAYLCIVIGTLFWTLFHSHALVLTNIIQIGPNIFICYFQQGIYLSFISYYSLFKETTTILLMTICGLWSIKNIRTLHRIRPNHRLAATVATVATGPQPNRSKDGQLSFMLIIDVTIHTLFSFVFGIFLIYQQITQNYMKSLNQGQIENIVRNLCLLSAGVPFCVSCYANLIVSKAFRNELKKILLCQRRFCLH